MTLCIHSAVRTVAAAAAAAAAASVRHCTPATRGVFMQQQYLPSIFIASYTNEHSLLLKYTPWQNSRFCVASALPTIISYLSLPIRACAKPQAGVSPPRRSPPRIPITGIYVQQQYLLRE